MFITAVCVLFLIKLRWAKNKSLYETHSLLDFFSEGRGRLYTGYSAQQWLQKGSVI